MYRKFIPFIFMMLVLYGAGGYFFVFKMQKAALREEVNRKIQEGQFESEVVTFRVHAARNLSSEGQTLLWEHAKEFSVNGEWYDIVGKEVISADSVVFRVLPDVQEKQIYAFLARQAKQDPADKGNPASRFLDFLEFSAIPNHFQLFRPGESDTEILKANYFFSLLPHTAEILSPPPQAA